MYLCDTVYFGYPYLHGLFYCTCFASFHIFTNALQTMHWDDMVSFSNEPFALFIKLSFQFAKVDKEENYSLFH